MLSMMARSRWLHRPTGDRPRGQPPSGSPSPDASGANGSLAGDGGQQSTNALWKADSKRLRNSLISLLVFFGLVVALLFAVPGLRSAGRRIEDASLGWVAAGVALEVASCVAYVVLFQLVFWRLKRGVAARLSLAELATNSVVSAGGIGGFALGAWVLRSGGAPLQRIAERSVVLYLLTSAANVGAVAVFGLLMWIGLVPGSTRAVLTLLPAAAAIGSVTVVLALGLRVTRAVPAASPPKRWWSVAAWTLGEGVRDALGLLRSGDPRLLGSVAYWLFDNLVLLACFHAYGQSPEVTVVFMGYLVGMLANSLPIPGGFGSVEVAVFFMLRAYGERPASLVLAAVLTYRAISLWVPSIIGTGAFWALRRDLGKPLLRVPLPAVES
jgi:uncharacterized membrane protein YbhN (UPF0104 family)